MRQALHSSVQLRDAWLKGGRAGRLDSSDGEQAALDRKLFTVGSQQRPGGAVAQFGGSCSENRAPEWLEVFPCEFGKLPGNLFVALCTGGGMENQGVVQETRQEQSGDLAGRDDSGFAVEISDDRTCATHGISSEQNRPVGMDVGDAAVVNNPD